MLEGECNIDDADDDCRFMQKLPVQFLQCEAIKSILICSIACCCLDHKEANSSVATFLTEFIRSARDKEVSSIHCNTFGNKNDFLDLLCFAPSNISFSSQIANFYHAHLKLK